MTHDTTGATDSVKVRRTEFDGQMMPQSFAPRHQELAGDPLGSLCFEKTGGCS